jgi:hypothetical protein
MKQEKLQWLENPSEMNGDNVNNIKHKTSRNKKMEYLKEKIDELATNSKNTNIRDPCRGINELKGVYQPRSNFGKDEIGDMLADSHILKLLLSVIECT